ncbi:MAG TPA: F0F1 ATP synthase subunit A [Chitinophagales bacterium]|nr:F0F1 ATP synthase subunit A [Chitinophagales bacterium]HNL84399.1 F0F1 ATP synthase subunit A [Chitinophagales bacterium]
MKRHISIFFFAFCLLLTSLSLAEEHTSTATPATTTIAEKPHEPIANEHATEAEHGNKDASSVVVEHIMNHISDANQFHVATVSGKHFVIALPCILYRNGKLSVFSSSRLEHDQEYDGYKLDEHSGRVVDAVTGKRSTNLGTYFTSHDSSKFLDFSITKNVFTSILGFIILAILLFAAKKAYTNRKGQAPKGLQSIIEPIVQFLVDDVIKPNIGPKYEKFVPFLLSIFFFILINNLIGLIPFFPGGANVSGNIAFTMTLAVLAFLMININGSKSYWGHIFAMPGVPKWVLVILTPVEIVGLFIKPIALMLRLFGNITGGHIAILSIVSLIFIFGSLGKSIGGASLGGAMAIPIVLFVNAMELFVAFLQAYVFTLLTSIFIGAALEEHEHEHEHH